ncbi:GHKL domain-containing protein [Kineothrix alysoides]|uniref:GHKL domain-containing protein n=1 Tax=Kineothrix alysoides TaxID=1469948 RepID=A0A4V2QBQ3_9FIRM|nr:ATP-binding protein [Kineothrix alysoides]TCL57312.1 GHKL domain-containing protein [Kineothrix alysoides]
MIFDTWLKISYMVQLIGACFIFMPPVRKRNYFGWKAGIAAPILIIFSYYLNSMYTEQTFGLIFFLYWGYYIAVCIGFVWLCLDCTLLESTYCAICACAMQHVAFDSYLIVNMLIGDITVTSVIIYAGVYVFFYFLFARKLPQGGRLSVSKTSMFPMVTIILLVWVLSVLDVSGMAGFEAARNQKIIYRIIDGLCCFYVLWVQVNQKVNMSLQRELDGINYAWRQQINQYQITQDTINSINLKCHDLKHQIRALRHMTDEAQKEAFFDEIVNDIMIYDTAVKTGNKALDTVLMEKGLICKNRNIQWSCMADGSKLDFMKLEDIYAMFGNALDNAIAAVLELSDPKKRVIGVKIVNQKKLIMIQIQNYYEKELRFEGGLPVTTKGSRRHHGYGMKSIRYTAEKYNGIITVQAQENIFMLQILLPVPE